MSESDFLFGVTVIAAMFVVASLFIFIADMVLDKWTRR
jgi:uncharacterized membrane protein (DUF485 family)